MTSKTCRAAIVGCGRIAGGWERPSNTGAVTTHAQAYRRDGRFALVAAADPDTEALTTFARHWSVPATYPTLSRMVAHEPRFDVVSLASPTSLHCEQLAELLRSDHAPRAIFAEKPVCESASDLAGLVALAGKSDTQVLVNHSRRFDPAHIMLSELVRAGEFGRLVGGRWTYYGGWLRNGTHIVDTLRMFFDDIAVLEAVIGAESSPGDPCLDVLLEVEGAPFVVESFGEYYYQLFEAEMRFECGRVLLRDFGSEIVIESVAVNAIEERVLVPSHGSPLAGLDSPILRATGEIAAFLETGKPLVATGALLGEAARTMEYMFAACELARDTEIRDE